jgi:ABC-type transport system involved in cytochrome c biogenesis permease component
MAATLTSEEPLSLLGITIRRSFTIGRAGFIYGTAMSLFFGILLAFSSENGFSASFPIILPIFASVASMAGLSVFTSDRLKGVLEYLMAYGVSPRRIFVNILVASMVLVTVLLAITLGIG